MLLALLAWAGLARAASSYFLETASLPERQAAQEVQNVVKGAGFESRVVRRFRLGRGWGFVVLVEDFADEPAAQAAATRLARDIGVEVTVFRLDAQRTVAIQPDAPEKPPEAASSVGDLLVRVRAAHGGPTGGAQALARAEAVHFVFTRSLSLGEGSAAVRHDYWRAGASRRLVVETGGAGTDSLAVATASGAWLRANGAVSSRDLGVLIGTVDAFAPEAVLTLALDVPALLDAPEVERFAPLEGAESGARVGQAGDESEPGLSFVDIDPGTARLLRARYVTDAGPVTFEMEGWREVSPGVVVPARVRIVRADGREEVVKVERLETPERAPSGIFDRPAP